MKKIDLHVHTKSTAADRPFVFDLKRLKDYVQVRKLDGIAITNHNEFDRSQFETIQRSLAITVLPGIELDVDGGQLLLIADGSDLGDFDTRCGRVSARTPNKKYSLSVPDLKDVFGDLSKHIIIPHYDKKPQVTEETLSALGACVTAGEVASPKKFMYCIRSTEKLVPVYFSDCRIEESTADFPIRQTYIGCDQVTFTSIKSCLRDKNKVALSASDRNQVFQVFDDGQLLSTGLNVILGKRSTGKSHTLKKIRESIPNARYIEQFSLVARDEEEDERKFNRYLSDHNSLFSREYLQELQRTVSEVILIDLEADARSVDAYVKSLHKHAKESEKHDAFSKARPFSEELYPTVGQKGLEELIESTQNLIKNIEFRETIEKHVSIESLKRLIVELMATYGDKERQRLKKTWINDLISEIKRKLQVRTAATSITDLDLYTIAMNRVSVNKFEKVVRAARTSHELNRKPLQGFELVATAGEYEGAMELKSLSKLKAGFKDAYEVYGRPYEFLQKLKNIDGVGDADLYKFFVKVDFKILNNEGFEASGGERSEFNLLQEIEDAQKSDILLIDEPESSFDNLFLKASVNELIKDISKNMPVVLVTHNNTVGASIKPDYLLYTSKEVEESKTVYRIYSGFPSSKHLLSTNGKTVSTWEITMRCLEAGIDAYNERKDGYEDIRD